MDFDIIDVAPLEVTIEEAKPETDANDLELKRLEKLMKECCCDSRILFRM